MRAAPAVRTESGLLLLDKSAGCTSHDVVLQARRALGVKRIGHTGTLDPFATGLILLVVGAFTRLADLFHELPKTYDATLVLGSETDTDDLTGRSLGELGGSESLTPETIRQAFHARLGPGLQTPSTFSAKRVAGQRAYDMAREGRVVELAPVPIAVHGLEVTGIDLPSVHFRARVSTGTFVRALARDIGRDLGTGAHLTRLRRVEIGPFRVEESAAELDRAAGAASSGPGWRRGASILPWLPERVLGAEDRAAIRQGRAIARTPLMPPQWTSSDIDARGAAWVALTEDGELVAVAEEEGERLQPRKVFIA